MKHTIYTFILLFFVILQGIQGVSGQDRSIEGGIPSPSAVTLDSTNLPLIIIDTHGQIIQDEPKITAHMKIIFNDPPRQNRPTDPGNMYDGYVGIEIRGSYSASLPQKPYGFETRDSLGNNLNVPILNMPPDNDWVLIANYNDKVFIRNTLAFDLFSKMGHYQPHTRICEVVVNGEYMGIYILTERIKQGKGRVDISKLTAADTTGDDLTGGYIFKIDNSEGSDGWRSAYEAIDCPGTARYPYFIYSDPQPQEIAEPQKWYIRNYVAMIDSILRCPSWADPLAGYRSCLDVGSFTDVFIVGEVSRNVDTYKKSAFFTKDKDSVDGRLHAGPVWDFDWAWKNIRNEFNADATDGSGWMYRISSDGHTYPVPPGWMSRLLEDTAFADEMHTRYHRLRESLLSDDFFYRYIDSINTLVNQAQVRHYQRWPILGGHSEGAPEADAQPGTFVGEIVKFKNWITTRLLWLDANMPGKEIPETSIRNSGAVPSDIALCQNYPNPFNPMTSISFTLPRTSTVSLSVHDILGREVAVILHDEKREAGTYEVMFNGSNLSSGVYIYTFLTENYVASKKMALVK